jgi:rhodanese-related sulfurtransferase
MKELERTKNISVGAVIVLLALIIALVSYKKPKFLYTKNINETITEINNNDYLMSLNDLTTDKDKYVIVDLRQTAEFNKANLESSVNIFAPHILDDNSISFLNDATSDGKMVALYAANPTDANNVRLILFQIGFNNVKVLAINTKFEDNKFITEEASIEKLKVNLNEFMKQQELLRTVKVVKEEKPLVKKAVVPIKKVKEEVTEGGC